MRIITLPAGQPATVEDDCIRIRQLADGQFALAGNVLMVCGDGETVESVGLIGGDPYPDYESAEAAGLAWANDHCVALIHVSRSRGTEPLPDHY